MSQLTEFLFPAPAERRPGAIWLWWEKRRLAYNVWVGSAGLVTVLVGAVISLLPPAPLGPPPLSVIWIPIAIFGALANVFYTSGAVIEVLVNKVWGHQVLPVGPALYRMGLTFSVGLALFPTLILVIGWILRVVTGLF
jgi:hypothetical protein